MPVLSLVRRLVTMPGAVLALGDRLLDDLGELHQQMRRANDEVARTRHVVEHASSQLEELIGLSHQAMARMERATEDMERLEGHAEELTPIAEEASRTLDDVATGLDHVPGIDTGGDR